MYMWQISWQPTEGHPLFRKWIGLGDVPLCEPWKITQSNGGFLSHRGTPSHHPFRTMGLSLTKIIQLWWYLHDYGNPQIPIKCLSISTHQRYLLQLFRRCMQIRGVTCPKTREPQQPGAKWSDASLYVWIASSNFIYSNWTWWFTVDLAFKMVIFRSYVSLPADIHQQSTWNKKITSCMYVCMYVYIHVYSMYIWIQIT